MLLFIFDVNVLIERILLPAAMQLFIHDPFSPKPTGISKLLVIILKIAGVTSGLLVSPTVTTVGRASRQPRNIPTSG